MTPEEKIAHQILGDWVMGPLDMGSLESAIATAIRVERERAARICEDVGRDGGTAFDAAQAIRES